MSFYNLFKISSHDFLQWFWTSSLIFHSSLKCVAFSSLRLLPPKHHHPVPMPTASERWFRCAGMEAAEMCHRRGSGREEELSVWRDAQRKKGVGCRDVYKEELSGAGVHCSIRLSHTHTHTVRSERRANWKKGAKQDLSNQAEPSGLNIKQLWLSLLYIFFNFFFAQSIPQQRSSWPETADSSNIRDLNRLLSVTIDSSSAAHPGRHSSWRPAWTRSLPICCLWWWRSSPSPWPRRACAGPHGGSHASAACSVASSRRRRRTAPPWRRTKPSAPSCRPWRAWGGAPDELLQMKLWHHSDTFPTHLASLQNQFRDQQMSTVSRMQTVLTQKLLWGGDGWDRAESGPSELWWSEQSKAAGSETLAFINVYEANLLLSIEIFCKGLFSVILSYCVDATMLCLLLRYINLML